MRRIWIVGLGKSNEIEKFLKLAGLGCKEICQRSDYGYEKGVNDPHVIISVNDERAARDCREKVPLAKIIMLEHPVTVERLRNERVTGPWDELLPWSYYPTDREKARLESAVRKHLADIPAYKPGQGQKLRTF